MSLLTRLIITAFLLPATAFAIDPYVPDDLQDWKAAAKAWIDGIGFRPDISEL